MDPVGTLLQRYREAHGDKCRQLVMELVWDLERRNDPRVLPFCLRVASDPREYDLARVEVFKWFELAPFPDPSARQQIADVIRSVLRQDPEDLVRVYAAAATWRFLDVEGVLEDARAVLLNPAEDPTVRWNAFAIVGALGPTPEGIGLAQALTSDPTFAQAATFLLTKWKVT